ncbi:MAG: hypothetical protein V1794_07175 [Candidatus Glassbacteria bacterium]
MKASVDRRPQLLCPENVAKLYVVLVAAGLLLAGYSAYTLFWGVSILGDFQAWVTVVALAAIAGGLLPKVRKLTTGLICKSGESPEPSVFGPNRDEIAALIIACLALAFFQRTPVMGDGHYFIYQQGAKLPAEMALDLKRPFCDWLVKELYSILRFALGPEVYLAAATSAKSRIVWSFLAAVGAFFFFWYLFKLIVVLAGGSGCRARLLAALVMTTGTMALFSGYAELVAVRMALLSAWLYVSVLVVEGKVPPWAFFALLFFSIGFYVTFVALAPAAAYVIIARRKDVRAHLLAWILSIFLPLALFTLLVEYTIGTGDFFGQFFAQREVLAGAAGEQTLYGAFSAGHFYDLLNVFFMHSPLNLLLAGWTVNALVSYRRAWIGDRVSLLLVAVTAGLGLELFVFNPDLGMQRDWDIFAPLALAVPLLSYRLWHVGRGQGRDEELARVLVPLLPLALVHLSLWTAALHSRDILLKRVMRSTEQSMYYTKASRRIAASAVAVYCLNEDYRPAYLIERAGCDLDWRELLFYWLSEIGNHRQMESYIDSLSDELTDLDLGNIGTFWLKRNQLDDALYYFRRSYSLRKETDEEIVVLGTCIVGLVDYYAKTGRDAAAIYYSTYLPDDMLKELYPWAWTTVEKWRLSGTEEETLAGLERTAALHIFNNGIALVNHHRLKTALLELQEAKRLGYDSLQVNRAIATINRRLMSQDGAGVKR